MKKKKSRRLRKDNPRVQELANQFVADRSARQAKQKGKRSAEKDSEASRRNYVETLFNPSVYAKLRGFDGIRLIICEFVYNTLSAMQEEKRQLDDTEVIRIVAGKAIYKFELILGRSLSKDERKGIAHVILFDVEKQKKKIMFEDDEKDTD